MIGGEWSDSYFTLPFQRTPHRRKRYTTHPHRGHLHNIGTRAYPYSLLLLRHHECYYYFLRTADGSGQWRISSDCIVTIVSGRIKGAFGFGLFFSAVRPPMKNHHARRSRRTTKTICDRIRAHTHTRTINALFKTRYFFLFKHFSRAPTRSYVSHCNAFSYGPQYSRGKTNRSHTRFTIFTWHVLSIPRNRRTAIRSDRRLLTYRYVDRSPDARRRYTTIILFRTNGVVHFTVENRPQRLTMTTAGDRTTRDACEPFPYTVVA